MAINSTLITNVLRKHRNQFFADAVTKRSAMYNLLRKEGPSSPQGPTWQVKVASNGSASLFVEGGTFPAAGNFEQVEATLPWGHYVALITLTGTAERQLEIGGGDAKIINYFRQQLTDANAQIVDLMHDHTLGGNNTATVNGQTAQGIIGVTAAIGDTGSYAGISRSTYTVWQSYVNDNSGTPRALTIALMDDCHNNLVDVRGGSYNAVLMSQTQFDNYTQLSSGVPSPHFQIPGTGPASLTFNAGYTGATYKGRPVLVIPGYNTSRIDFVNLDALSIELLRPITVSEPRRQNDDTYWDITIEPQMKLRNPYMDAASLQDLSA